MNFLMIPDGLRRYAHKHAIPLRPNYSNGGAKLFADIEQLFELFDVVGAWPLARYNLQRNKSDVEALLLGAYAALETYVGTCTRRVIVIGDTDHLLQHAPAFANVLDHCDVNPHLHGCLAIIPGSVVLYLCYDGMLYARQLLTRFSDTQIRQNLIQWNYAFRTGCDQSLFRFSGLFFGIEQTWLACTPTLYQEISIPDILRQFQLTRQ